MPSVSIPELKTSKTLKITLVYASNINGCIFFGLLLARSLLHDNPFLIFTIEYVITGAVCVAVCLTVGRAMQTFAPVSPVAVVFHATVEPIWPW